MLLLQWIRELSKLSENVIVKSWYFLVNVSFEGELAQYLTEVAEAWNKTIPEVLVYLVKEEFEAEKEMAEIIKERDVPGAKTVAHEDVDWGDDVES